jgi:hypothetical protein
MIVSTYILVIWTVVASSGSAGYKTHDWRTIGEFRMDTWTKSISAKDMCENAARELQLKKFMCVRNS